MELPFMQIAKQSWVQVPQKAELYRLPSCQCNITPLLSFINQFLSPLSGVSSRAGHWHWEINRLWGQFCPPGLCRFSSKCFGHLWKLVTLPLKTLMKPLVYVFTRCPKWFFNSLSFPLSQENLHLLHSLYIGCLLFCYTTPAWSQWISSVMLMYKEGCSLDGWLTIVVTGQG